MDELDEETNETHDQEPDGGGLGHLHELCATVDGLGRQSGYDSSHAVEFLMKSKHTSELFIVQSPVGCCQYDTATEVHTSAEDKGSLVLKRRPLCTDVAATLISNDSTAGQ